jgi:hypothetical protein
MRVENVVLTGSAGTARVKRTPQEIEAFLAWNRRFDKESRRLNAIEPIPDNFEDICKGKAWPPEYST